jgi:hypothetical protein
MILKWFDSVNLLDGNPINVNHYQNKYYLDLKNYFFSLFSNSINL